MKTYFFLLLAAGIILLTSCRKEPSNPADDASAQQISSSQPSDTPAESLPEVTGPAAEAEPATPPQPQPETQPAPIAQTGQPAPDFVLPRLTFEIQADGSTLGKLSNETVKLSSFKGKKPVFLIFSSYT